MFQKHLQEPQHLRKLQALCRRTPETHPSYERIHADLKAAAAGYAGERLLTYPLERFSNQLHIFQGLRLPVAAHHYVQIDLLLISEQGMAIGEVKHWRGDIQLNDWYGPLYRTYFDKTELLPNPLLQVEEQREGLLDYFNRHSLLLPEIETFVIFTHREAQLRLPPTTNLPKIFLKERLPQMIRHHFTSSETQPLLHPHHYTNQILTDHKPLQIDVLQKYQVKCEDLLPGVQCASCCNLSMSRTQGVWRCLHCHTSQADAHVTALRDYQLLLGSHITNKDARHFLQVPSRHACRRILLHTATHVQTPSKRPYYRLFS
ncbi:nuclease-like protein [Salsuginibacillus halophilus]|uniref:Nuclease-like protein n=1 Tax=Salsuginibacillus halophilus TaxID=517424 RepID=A0A2P8HQW1_9BACI|nr:nuclease-related domain-containing protein [Salsuginibacillus halophilus]PSL48610.1 nuclease-like protein [Salsuginibacillus halophilus]